METRASRRAGPGGWVREAIGDAPAFAGVDMAGRSYCPSRTRRRLTRRVVRRCATGLRADQREVVGLVGAQFLAGDRAVRERLDVGTVLKGHLLLSGGHPIDHRGRDA